MKRSVTVAIAGAKYSLRSDDDEETVKRFAAHVDARIRDIQRQTRTADTQALAILAALQITQDLFHEREAHASLRKKVRERSRSLLALLEKAARV